MRRYIYIIAILAVSAITSCTKDLEAEPTLPTIDKKETLESKTKMLSISLSSSSGIETRAFFDESATLEPWEGEMQNVSIFIYKMDEDGGNELFIARKDLTDKQLTDMRLTFAVDDVDEGDTIMVIGIANSVIPQGITNLYELAAYAYNSEITEYNGMFSSMCSGSLRKGGFELIGECDEVLIGDDDFTTIEVLFTPVVSKVAMELTVSETFSDNYPGDIRVDSVTANNILLKMPFVGVEEYCVIAQDPNIEGENYQNLFYLYPYSTPLFVIDATYDLDGDFATTDDQTPMSYNIRLTDEYGNEETIGMSSYYRIKGTIVGLAGAGVVLQLTVSDWAEVRDFDLVL